MTEGTSGSPSVGPSEQQKIETPPFREISGATSGRDATFSKEEYDKIAQAFHECIEAFKQLKNLPQRIVEIQVVKATISTALEEIDKAIQKQALQIFKDSLTLIKTEMVAQQESLTTLEKEALGIKDLDGEKLKEKLVDLIQNCKTEQDVQKLLDIKHLLPEKQLHECFHPAFDAVTDDEKGKAANLFFQVLGKKCPQFLCERAQYEISIAEEKTILRGNSFFSKLLGHYQRQVLSPFFEKHLKPILLNLDTKKPYELDPKKLQVKQRQQEKTLEQNNTKITEFSEEILQCLIDHGQEIPKSLRKIYQTIETAVDEKFGQTVNGKEFSITTFMLRAVAPAVVTPKLWGSIPEEQEIKPTHQRNLLLISKHLQNVANPIKEAKEPYMQEIYQNTQAKHFSLMDQAYTSLFST